MNFIIELWQNLPFHINPIALNIGPLQFRWYSIMYLLSILTVFFLYIRHCKKNNLNYNLDKAYELFIYSFMGIIIGARIGYALFYEFSTFLASPLLLINPFQNGELVGISGLSYHGGAIGFLLAMLLYCKKYKLNFFNITNILSLYVPLGYTFGRIGNFLNQELYGRATTSLLGMYFPGDDQKLLRYPSQLAEAFMEGIFIYILILLISKTIPASKKIITPLYCLLYGTARFLTEFIREPDNFQTLFINVFTYGQILSIIMIIIGIILIPIYIKNYENN
ncbi:MAG: prolipoprotein diacylglyceryl transferase [Candidatus Riflemargulisbacteria bacterium]